MTLGDPRGIGPEVIRCAALTHLAETPDTELKLIGPAGMDPAVASYLPVEAWDGTKAGAGRAAAAAIEAAVDLAVKGEVDAVVTGPIDKGALAAAGFDVPGHTELLQRLTGVPTVGMLMVAEETHLGPPLRVLLATTHLALRDVPERFTTDLLVEQTRLLHEALCGSWQISHPRIALCAFNPHASDGGLFGDEEARIYRPAIARLEEEGIEVAGPLPADTVFTHALKDRFDAVVAPYHDVGMSAFKTISFGRGVNVTLGLPFVRTSPDHGTALDIAGTGVADSTSTREALRLAVRLVLS